MKAMSYRQAKAMPTEADGGVAELRQTMSKPAKATDDDAVEGEAEAMLIQASGGH